MDGLTKEHRISEWSWKEADNGVIITGYSI